MKQTKWCWLLLLASASAVRAQAADDLPTLPALPAAVADSPPPLPNLALPAHPPPIDVPERTPAPKSWCGRWLCDPLRRLVAGRVDKGGEPAAVAAPAAEQAAAVKSDAKNAEKRRQAVRYVGRVGCRYSLEAENGLLMALRTDDQESVRHEAALALSNSGCWTARTLAALRVAVAGSSADGYPPERSERVRRAAWNALNRYAMLAGQPQLRALPANGPPPDQYPLRQTAAQMPLPYYAYPPSVPHGPGSGSPFSGSLRPLTPIGPIPETQPPAFQN